MRSCKPDQMIPTQMVMIPCRSNAVTNFFLHSRLQLRLKSAVGDQRVMRVWQPGQSTIFCMGVTGKAVWHLGHTTVLGRGICWTGGCIGSS